MRRETASERLKTGSHSGEKAASPLKRYEIQAKIPNRLQIGTLSAAVARLSALLRAGRRALRSRAVAVLVRRMHTGEQPQPQADPLQQREQLFALPRAQVGEQLALEVIGQRERALEQGAAAVREVELARATVERVVAALQQAAGFERVHERDHAARRDLQQAADRLLGAPLGGGDGAQEREFPRLQLERCERRPKARGHRITE